MSALRIDERVRDLRRAIGPVAWFVLEELMLGEAGERPDGRAVRASVRSLASAVSLNKDTVARALRVLARAGIVVLQPQATAVGRFGSGGYLVAPVAGIDVVGGVEHTPTTPTRPSKRTPPPPNQLQLLDPQPISHHLQNPRPQPRPPKQDDALAPSVSRRPVSGSRRRDGTSGGRSWPC
jgi:DNA-binding transcriptional MocR family regulator